MMLVPCYTFVVLLLVASSNGAYLSVTRGEEVTAGSPYKKAFRIPDGQRTGWLTENELSCIHKDSLGIEHKHPPILLTVQFVDKVYPDVTVADDLLSVKIIRGQNKGSVLVNVAMYCKQGYTRSAGQPRDTDLVDLKPVALEEE